MAGNYIYFAGSLPMLFFGETPSLSLSDFDEAAQRLTDPHTAQMLRQAVLYTSDTTGLPADICKFYDWETALRNALLDVRKKFRVNAVDCKRGNPDFYSEIPATVTQAANAPDLLEAEKILDRARFQALEYLSAGHYFDLEFLMLYRIKLQILEKYLPRTPEAGNRALEQILENVMNTSKTN